MFSTDSFKFDIHFPLLLRKWKLVSAIVKRQFGQYGGMDYGL